MKSEFAGAGNRNAVIARAPLFAAVLTFTVVEGAAASAYAPELEKCARAPTVQCVAQLRDRYGQDETTTTTYGPEHSPALLRCRGR